MRWMKNAGLTPGRILLNKIRYVCICFSRNSNSLVALITQRVPSVSLRTNTATCQWHKNTNKIHFDNILIYSFA